LANCKNIYIKKHNTKQLTFGLKTNCPVSFYIIPVEGADTKVGLCLGHKLALVRPWIVVFNATFNNISV